MIVSSLNIVDCVTSKHDIIAENTVYIKSYKGRIISFTNTNVFPIFIIL